MTRSTLLTVFALAAFAASAGAQSTTQAGAASPAAAPAGPDVGQLAPDFTAAWADSTGARSTPVSLASLRGKVVVLAFYPKDRTGGCTAQLTQFRDQYGKLFGDGVVVLPISADSIPSHVSWASETKLPFALVSDPQLAAADLYGSHIARR